MVNRDGAVVTASNRYSDRDLPQYLNSGDHMTREEFHRIYEKTPEDVRAELIGGIVFVASPLKRTHGTFHVHLSSILAAYQAQTPGLEVCDNATVFLSEEDEVQPDLLMRVLPDHGGKTRNTNDDYIEGSPELIAEIALSSWAIDLHRKRERYKQAGVSEYIVVCLEPKQLRWFDLSHDQEFSAAADGVMRSMIFPGLWMPCDVSMLEKYQCSMEILSQGLTSREHADFVTSLTRSL